MNTQFWTSVLLGGVLAGIVWVFLPWKNDAEVENVKLMKPPVTRSVSSGSAKGREIFEELDRAESDQTKLVALDRLRELTPRELKLEMDEWSTQRFNQEHTFAVKAMILRMAELDPLGAFEWIEKRSPDDFYGDHGLGQAWRLVSVEWAHQDPLALLDIWIDAKRPPGDPLQLSYDPLQLWDQELSDMLLAGRPEGWMTLYHISDQDLTGSSKYFVSRLRTRGEFREALNTWNHPPIQAQQKWEKGLVEGASDLDKEWAEKSSNPKINLLAQAIIQRWREVDEEVFLGSEFVGWEMGGE